MSKNAKAGIFVIVTVLILIAGWAWLAQVSFGGGKYEVTVEFPDVTGLRINDPIRVWGVDKGNVKRIEFKKTRVEVELMLENDVELYSDAYAAILDVAMISGTKYVKLDPGRSGVPHDLSIPIPGRASLGIPLSLIGDLGKRLNEILTLLDAELFHSLGATLESLSEATSSLAGFFRENEDDLTATVRNMRQSTKQLVELTDVLTTTTVQIDSLVTDIRTGKGSLGKAMEDDSLYYELRATLSSVRRLADDIRRDPRRYFRLF